MSLFARNPRCSTKSKQKGYRKGGLVLTSNSDAPQEDILVQPDAAVVRGHVENAISAAINSLDSFESDGIYLKEEDVVDAMRVAAADAAAAISAQVLRIINHSRRGAGNCRQELRFVGPRLHHIARVGAKK
jgi:hypothetical protein